MCLIIIAEKNNPEWSTLSAAEVNNPHGAGIAWKEKSMVRWRKGLSAVEVWEIIKTKRLSLPYVVHFRLATVGNGMGLCHPFPLTPKASTALSGTAPAVMFHNGHWSEWNEFMLREALTPRVDVPDGPWSDSRAAAWLIARHGHKIAHFIPGRIAILSTAEATLYGQGWMRKDGCVYSSPPNPPKQIDPWHGKELHWRDLYGIGG